MPSIGLYRCPKCGTVYRPRDAGDRRFFCCNVSLERVESGRRVLASPSKIAESVPVTPTSAPTPRMSHTPAELLEIIPPRENTVDALAVHGLLSTFAAETSFSLEIAGDARVRRFLIRAPHETLVHLRRQIQATYDQAEFRTVPPDQDPARDDGLARLTAECTLKRPIYQPLQTFRDGDFLEADPVRGLLGAFANLEEGERMLAQLVLFPADPDWAQPYVGSSKQIEQSFGGGPRSQDQFVQQLAGFVVSLILLVTCLWGVVAYLQHRWLDLVLASTLAVAALVGFGYVLILMMERGKVDPEMVKRKTDTRAAYDAALRLVAFAQTTEQARTRLRALARAYHQYNLASGNALGERLAKFDPHDITLKPRSWLQKSLGRGMLLNVDEIASMWHLPVGFEPPFVERTRAKRLLPLATTVENGILVGHSVHQGEKMPVRLDPASLRRHIFMVAKTQKGKSTLMAHLAAEAMRQDTSLVVIDPHGDLARALLGVVPRERASDVVYVDFSDKHQVVGLNLLDLRQGRSADAIVSNIVHVGELIWSDNWGPRMEDAFRTALRTLLAANEILVQKGEPQFTLLDIPPLFELANFRHKLIERYIGDQELMGWWAGYFERLYENLRMDVINPVLTKIHRFSAHTTVRNIVGQSSSTVNFKELLNERRILLINTATGVIGPDAGGLLSAVLMDYISFAVREQMAIPDPAARTRVVIVIDEFQSIPGVDYKMLLAELQKMGASCILATQALGQLDAIDRTLRSAIMSNISSLFVFQTSAEDAKLLQDELDNVVTITDIINLDDYTCYLKSQLERKRMPVMYLETMPPPKREEEVVARITAQMARYVHSIAWAEAERDKFQEQWYGRERNLLRQLMLQGRLLNKSHRRSVGSEDETASTTPRSDAKAEPGVLDQMATGPGEESRRSKEPSGKRRANP